MYVIYECSRCKKSSILLKDEVDCTHREEKYLSCSHCGCKKLILRGKNEDLRECMKARRYKRNSRGAIEQY